MSIFLTILVIIGSLLALCVIAFLILMCIAINAPDDAEAEYEGTDPHIIQSARSATQAEYPKTTRISDMSEPMGM